MTGRLAEVVVVPNGARVIADATIGATTLQVDDATSFDPAGGHVLLDVDTTPRAYAGVASVAEDFSGALTLTSPLDVAAPADTMVTTLAGDGTAAQAWSAVVVVDENEPGVDVAIPTALQPFFIPGTAQVGMLVDFDPAAMVMLSQPEKVGGFDGTALTADTLTTNALAAATTNDILNGTFEDVGSSASQPFAGWRLGAAVGPEESSTWYAAEVGNQIAGSRSMMIWLYDDAAGRTVVTDRIYPVQPGQRVKVCAYLRAYRHVDRTGETDPNLARLGIMTSDGTVDPEQGTVQDACEVAELDDLAPTAVYGTAVVPDGHTQMRIYISAGASGDGAAWGLTVDEVHRDRNLPPLESSGGYGFNENGNAKAVELAAETASIATLTAGSVDVPSLDVVTVNGTPLLDVLDARYQLQPTPPAPDQIKEYRFDVTRWYSNSGALGGTTGDMGVGFAGSWGHRKAVFWMTTAVRAQMTSDLAGMTIKYIGVRLTCTSRRGEGPGSVQIGYHTDGIAATTFASVAGKVLALESIGGWWVGTQKLAGLSAPGAETVGSLSNWRDGTIKGLVFTNPTSQSTDYGLSFQGDRGGTVQSAYEPVLKVVYHA